MGLLELVLGITFGLLELVLDLVLGITFGLLELVLGITFGLQELVLEVILGITFNPPTGVNFAGVIFLILIDAQGGLDSKQRLEVRHAEGQA